MLALYSKNQAVASQYQRDRADAKSVPASARDWGTIAKTGGLC